MLPDRPKQEPRFPTRDQGQPPRGPGQPPTPPPGPPRRIWLFFVLILLANILLTRIFFPGPKPVKVPYTLFKQEVVRGNVDRIYSRGESMTGRFRTPSRSRPSPTPRPARNQRPVIDFSTTLPAFVDPGLEALLIEHGVEISAEPIEAGDNPWIDAPLQLRPGASC